MKARNIFAAVEENISTKDLESVTGGTSASSTNTGFKHPLDTIVGVTETVQLDQGVENISYSAISDVTPQGHDGQHNVTITADQYHALLATAQDDQDIGRAPEEGTIANVKTGYDYGTEKHDESEYQASEKVAVTDADYQHDVELAIKDVDGSDPHTQSNHDIANTKAGYDYADTKKV